MTLQTPIMFSFYLHTLSLSYLEMKRMVSCCRSVGSLCVTWTWDLCSVCSKMRTLRTEILNPRIFWYLGEVERVFVFLQGICWVWELEMFLCLIQHLFIACGSKDETILDDSLMACLKTWWERRERCHGNTIYTFCCSFTQNIQSFTSTVETITQIYIH